MNKIYWDKDKISIITDQMEAVSHKHWAMQLFLCMEKELEISVSKQPLVCKCIAVNQNVEHSFSAGNHLHFSLIIEPASNIAGQLNKIMNGSEYYIFDTLEIAELQRLILQLTKSSELNNYQNFMTQLYHFLGIHKQSKPYDNRIEKLLYEIEHCNCDTHSIASFAAKVSLSPSRLSHLFREQVGLPLKSYIQFHQMKKAFLALSNGKNITQAAMLANFDSPSHFAAVTKKMMGMPASIFSKNSVFLKVTSV